MSIHPVFLTPSTLRVIKTMWPLEKLISTPDLIRTIGSRHYHSTYDVLYKLYDAGWLHRVGAESHVGRSGRPPFKWKLTSFGRAQYLESTKVIDIL